MAGNVTFNDYSIEVMAELDETMTAWLYEAANEVTAQAQRTCVMEDDAGKRLKGSYANNVDESKGEATVGTPLEEGFWEEFGTGEYAAHGDGRKGWWVFIRGQASQGGGKSYASKEEAEEAAAFLRAVKGLDAVVTNGRPPNYTLERAFDSKKAWAEKRAAEMLKERME
jgi:hypothetical protein